MSILDDEDDSPDNLGSIGEQDSAPVDMPRSAAPDAEWPPPVPGGGAAPAPPMPGVPTGQIVTRAVTPSPAEVANLDAIDANTAARKDTADQAGNVAADRAVDQAAQIQAEADLKEQQARELAELQAQQRAHIEDRQRKDEAEYQRYRSMGLKDPDADASIGHRFGAALAIGLGQYSAAMNHTENKAAQLFEQARKDNFAIQRDAIERQKEASIKAGHDVEQAKRDAADAVHQLQIKNVAQIDAFRTKFQAESARMGIPAARIAATQTMQDIDRQALEARQKHLESTRTLSRDPTPSELRKGKGGGGGGAGALDKFVRAANELGPGDAIPPEVAVLGRAAGLKPNQIAAEVDRYRGSGAKSAKGKGAPQIGDVHGPGGAVIGNISTGDPALDRKRAEEVAKANAIYTDLAATLKALDESKRTDGKTLPSIKGFSLSDVAAKREALHSHALIQLKEMAKLGVLAGPDMSIMEAQLGSGLSNSSGIGGSKIPEIQKIVDSGHARFLDSVGLNGSEALPKLRGEATAGEPPKAAGEPKAAAASTAEKSDAERAKALINSPAYANFSSAKRAYLARVARGGKP